MLVITRGYPLNNERIWKISPFLEEIAMKIERMFSAAIWEIEGMASDSSIAQQPAGRSVYPGTPWSEKSHEIWRDPQVFLFQAVLAKCTQSLHMIGKWLECDLNAYHGAWLGYIISDISWYI